MPITPQELESFTQFAARRLSDGDTVPSLEECLQQWRADCERRELHEDVQASLEDYAAGRVKPLDQAFDDVRRQLGLPT
mgnify:CR=1 FL=1